MTQTREETLQVELEALKASLPEVARKARDEALEEAAKALLARRDQMTGRAMESGRRRGLEEGAAIVRARKSEP